MQIVNFFQKNSKSLLKIHYDNNLITLYLGYNISSIWLFFYIHVWHLGVCLSFEQVGSLRSPRQAYALYKNKPPKKAKSQPCGTGRSR